MYPIVWLVVQVLWLYIIVLIAYVVMGWLVAFNVVNGHNPYVRQIRVALARLTEPVLNPIRRFLPDLGPVDISPIVVFLLLQFLILAVQAWTGISV